MLYGGASEFGHERPGLCPAFERLAELEWDSASAPAKGVFGFDSRDIRSRPFNLLRTRLLKMMEANGWKSIGVVSATPGAGKSFVSSNLAAAMSRIPGQIVYLFDFDLRRSSIAGYFDYFPERGLNHFLTGEEDGLDHVARRLSGEQLAIFASTPTRASSAELLRSPRMDALVQAMKQLPPSVVRIVDLPPVFANDDASIMMAHLDAYLLVVEEGRTTRKQIRDCIRLLSPAPMAGSILNRYRGGLLGDDYGYGYGHQQVYAEYYS